MSASRPWSVLAAAFWAASHVLAQGGGNVFPECKEPPITISVLVLNYDPIIESEGVKRLHEVFGWNDPRKLADGYIADILLASGGFARYKVVEWRDLDEFPVKKDGFRYDDESFLKAFRETKQFHQPDGLDYEAMIESQKVVPLIDSGKVDEVWMFGAPYFGYWEAAMAGPGAYFINGGVYDRVPSKRPFAIMGFNYERGVAEMSHDLCHRAENHLKRAYGSWNSKEPQHEWDRFSAYEQATGGIAGVGNCHFPPNAEKGYDYANPRTVQSTADSWLTHPRMTRKITLVNRESWGGPDYHRNYMKWWFARLPKAPGFARDGRPNNWWKYIFRFTDYDAKGLPVKSDRQAQSQRAKP